MTIEERFERLEHFSAGMAEENRRQREEDRQLWRDTQRQINELSMRLVQWGDESRETDRKLAARIEQYAAESRAEDQRLRESIREADLRAREADERLGARIEALVSAIGKLLPPSPSAS